MEEASDGKPVSLPLLLDEPCEYSHQKAENDDCVIADADLKSGVELLVGGLLEDVGRWSVRESDFCDPCTEVCVGNIHTAVKDTEFPTSAGTCYESESLESRPRHSYILVPEASISQISRQNSGQVVKLAVLSESPPLPPIRRRGSTSVPSLYQSSDDNESIDLLFRAIPGRAPGIKSSLEAKLFVV